MCTSKMAKKNPNTTPILPPPPAPPFNDRCPICFDDFTLPCCSNCHHWFCDFRICATCIIDSNDHTESSCILEFWHYRGSLKPCKCPYCLTRITSLTPQLTVLPTEDSATANKVLKNVRKYNSLYAGGASAFIMKICMLPSVIKRCLLDMSDPDPARQHFYFTLVRTIALFLSIVYMVCSFDFIPRGYLSIPRFFELCGLVFMGFIHLFGFLHRYWLRRQVRN